MACPLYNADVKHANNPGFRVTIDAQRGLRH